MVPTNFNPTYKHPLYFIRKGLFRKISLYAPQLKGKLLDFGCGEKPYQSLFTNVTEYIGLDYNGEGHDHQNEAVDVYYDGVLMGSGSRNLTNRNSIEYGTRNNSIMPMNPSRGGRFVGVNILQMSVIGSYIDQSNVSDIHNNQIAYYGPQ